MVWVSGRKQSIPLADPFCLKEVRDNSVSSKGGEYLSCICSDFRGRVNYEATKPQGWFFHRNIGAENDYLSFVYPVWTKTPRRLFCNAWMMLYLQGGT
jgi:hypothetical protein